MGKGVQGEKGLRPPDLALKHVQLGALELAPTFSGGCRGVTGPVPQPLWIRSPVFSCPTKLKTNRS
jgi:hypothetical protein